MDLKERIITITIQQTTQVGVSSTTMDHIARLCGISKRTLYELFPDKLTLLTEAMRYSINKQRTKLSEIIANANNPLEALLHIYANIRNQINSTSRVMIEDIRRLYPSLYQVYLDEHSNNNRHFVNMLKKAQNQGLVRKNANIEAAVAGFSVLIHHVKGENFDYAIHDQFSEKDVLDESFITLIRGLASSESIATIDRFLENFDKKQ